MMQEQFNNELEAILIEGAEGSKEVVRDKEFSYLSIDCLVPNEQQARKNFNEKSLEELVSSIVSQGILQPIIVKPLTVDKYLIIAGERRWRAAKMLHLSEVPVIIWDVEDKNVFLSSLTENIQRENLNVIEEGKGYKYLVDVFNLTHEDIAQQMGKSRSEISNKIRILNLHPDVQRMLESNKISYGHAKVLLSFDEQYQLKIAEDILNKALTVRDIENLAKNYIKLGNNTNGESKIQVGFVEKANLLSEILSGCLSAKVKIIPNSKGEGRAIIYFNSLDEIERLINKLEK